MSRFWHGTFHVVMIGLQVASAVSLPTPFAPIVAGTLAGIQGIVALKNHKH
jgi:hypothetical protein